MKFVKILLCAGVAAIAIAAATPNAHALDLGLNAGVYIPTGDAGDNYDTGYALKGYVGMDVLPMFDARLFAGYYSAKADGAGYDDLSSTHGGLMLVFTPPVPVISPYVGVGYALHKTQYGVGQEEWGHGVIAEAGVGLSILVVELGLYANYMQNSVSDDNGDWDLGGYTAGVNASIGF